MSYEKQTFIDYPNEGYTVLKAEHLNHIEDGVARVSNIFPELAAGDFGKQLYVNEEGDGFLLLGNTTVIEWENLVSQAELARAGYIAGKGVAQADGTIRYQAAGSFFTCINMPVEENTTYYVGGPSSTNGSYARFINWQSEKYTGLSASGTITSMTDEEISRVTISMVNGTGAKEAHTSPSGAKYCTVSYYDLSQGGTPDNYLTTIENPEERVDKVINNNIEKVSSGKWNLKEEAEMSHNNWFFSGKVSGNYQGGGFYTYYNIPVSGGTSYYLGPAFNGQYARFINWSTEPYVLDSNAVLQMEDSEVTSISISRAAATKAEEHLAPVGAKYCSVTFYVGYGDPTITTDDCYFTSIEDPEQRVDGKPTYRAINNGVSQEVLDQINQNTEDIVSIKDKQDTLSLGQYNFIQRTRKPILNFQFDDAIVAGDTICKGIFDDFGYKCDFAITSKVANSTSESVYLDFQKQGFHILSHSTDGGGMGSVTDDADKEAKIAKMKTSYEILRSRGFDIHGWVTPSSSLHSSLYAPLAEIYDYGFGTGMSSSVYHKFGEEKYIAHMSRVGIESNLILKTAATAQAKVINYISSLWGVTATVDDEYSIVTINDATNEVLTEIAEIDGYEGVEISEGVINDIGVEYLREIWGVSIDDATLIINADDFTVSLTPTFKRCCEREGMKNIRNYIDTAISNCAFLSFYAHNTYSEDGAENGYGINLSKYTREILTYCKKVGATIMNSKDAVQDYFSFRYTDFLELKGV